MSASVVSGGSASTPPIGKANVVRNGADVTVVTISLSVQHALDVAGELDQGIDVEVLDLRSRVPLDRQAILESVAKTGHLVVVAVDYLSFGMSGEVLATVSEHDPTMLMAPARRVPVPDVPLPYLRRSSKRCCLATPELRRRSALFSRHDRRDPGAHSSTVEGGP